MEKTSRAAFASILAVVALGVSLGARGATAPFSRSAMEFARSINLGVNIGNTFDCPSGNELDWGTQRVTKSLIRLYKTKGIDAVRIPVTWRNHFSVDDPKHEIRRAFLDRVQDVVDMCMDEGMVVLLNIHHDGGSEGWPREWLTIDGVNEDRANAVLSDIWRQIATRFRAYDERLVFEAFNEIRKAKSHPGPDGGEEGKDDWGGKPLYCKTVNRYAKTFYDTVRATGGNNARRYLLIPTYAATDHEPSCMEWKHPNPSDSHVMVSIHAYEPGWFCLWSDRADYNREEFAKRLDDVFGMMKRVFLDKGIPVVIGETGADTRYYDKEKTQPNDADRVKWAKHYGYMAGRFGCPCFLWETGGDKGMSFIDRSKVDWTRPDYVDAFQHGLDAGRRSIKNSPALASKGAVGSVRN